MARAADKYDITAVADLIAERIFSALDAGGSYTLEDSRRMNLGEGWTYELSRRDRPNERVEGMRLSEEQLDRAWLTEPPRRQRRRPRLALISAIRSVHGSF